MQSDVCMSAGFHYNILIALSMDTSPWSQSFFAVGVLLVQTYRLHVYR